MEWNKTTGDEIISLCLIFECLLSSFLEIDADLSKPKTLF